MGVTHLWQILQPIANPIKIQDLKNKTIAVDLSIWICENTTFKHNSQNLKPHLRNLFFRCKSLLEIGCTLVFIREGDVIELKRDTMQKRNNVRFGNNVGKKQAAAYEAELCEITDSLSLAASKSKPKKRSNFDFYINECCELLNYIGVAVIRSPCGEAEKSCAYLDLIGKCDGVISDDSDVFLYGAKTVYRNFNIDKKSEISIEEYKMSDIEAQMGYNREMLVAFALFLGCDYDQKGIPGCGVQMAIKFFNEVKELERKECRKVNVLDLLRKWQSNDYESNGMPTEEKLRRIVNTNIDHPFPNEKIIREYLFMEDNHKKILTSEFDYNHKWRRPNLYLNQRFNEMKQTWEYKYTAEKMIPLIILYENLTNVRSVRPLGVSKSRKQAGVDYYEVRWSRMTENNSYNDRDLSELNEYVTLEKPDVFESYYPDLINEFKESLVKKKSTKKTSKKKNKEKVENEVELEVIEKEEEVEERYRVEDEVEREEVIEKEEVEERYYVEDEVREEQVCSQFEIKRVLREDTIIVLDDDSDDTDSEPIIITHVKRMEEYTERSKVFNQEKTTSVVHSVEVEINLEMFEKHESSKSNESTLHEINQFESSVLTDDETNKELACKQVNEEPEKKNDQLFHNQVTENVESNEEINEKIEEKSPIQSITKTLHHPNAGDATTKLENDHLKIAGKPPLPPMSKINLKSYSELKPAFEQQIVKNVNQSNLVAGFAERYFHGFRQANNVERDTLRDNKSKNLIESDSSDDDVVILSSSDDENDKQTSNKNADVKNLLEKFNLIKLESTTKKPKKIVSIEERKPLKTKFP